MRRVRASLLGISRRTVARVVSMGALVSEWRPELSWLVKATSQDDVGSLQRLRAGGLNGVCAFVERNELADEAEGPIVVAPLASVEANDVVAMTPGRGELHVLYRESDAHHTVFLTNRCNSRCVMCSQPPTNHDDSWLVEEAKQLARHVGRAPALVGFTGGEPLLLGVGLRDVIQTFHAHLPETRFEILTNGRRLSDRALAEHLLGGLPKRVCWMVPLYGHADFLHDHVVQCEGAFDETIGGLLNLQASGQAIQLRVVLIEPVLEALTDLCIFVAKNMPFVREVALMGCEPVGFALANRSICETDIRQWAPTLSRAVHILQRGGLPVMLMNLPLCALPEDLWPLAQRSISDWKQVYAPECAKCSVRADCCGLFAWHKRGWRPTTLQPISEMAPT
jgi:His-Xaa-Ser system radical SAM maturase HxsC